MADQTPAPVAAGSAITPGDPKPAPVASPGVIGLQQVVSEKAAEIKRLAARVAELEGTPSADDELATAKAELAQERAEKAVFKAKAEHPELADFIDVFVAENKSAPSDGVLALVKAQFAASAASAAPGGRPETSGIRNSPAGEKQTEAERVKEILKSSQLWG